MAPTVLSRSCPGLTFLLLLSAVTASRSEIARISTGDNDGRCDVQFPTFVPRPGGAAGDFLKESELVTEEQEHDAAAIAAHIWRPGGKRPSSTGVWLNIPASVMDWSQSDAGHTTILHSVHVAALFFGTYVDSSILANFTANHTTDTIQKSVVDEIGQALRLRTEIFSVRKSKDSSTSAEPGAELSERFLGFMARHLRMAHPVIGGFYVRGNGGAPRYDNVLPVVGLHTVPDTASPKAIPRGTHARHSARRSDLAPSHHDQVKCSVHRVAFNDLFQDFTVQIGGKELLREREQWQTACPPQLPYAYTLPVRTPAGFAVTDVVNEGNEELCRVVVRKVDSGPAKVHLSATFFGLRRGAGYSVYRFDGLGDAIPESDFKEHAFLVREFEATAAVVEEPRIATLNRTKVVSFRCVMTRPPPGPPAAGRNGSLIISRLPFAALIVAFAVILTAVVFFFARRFRGRGGAPHLLYAATRPRGTLFEYMPKDQSAVRVIEEIRERQSMRLSQTGELLNRDTALDFGTMHSDVSSTKQSRRGWGRLSARSAHDESQLLYAPLTQ